MLELWLFYDRHYQRVPINEYDFDRMTIGSSVDDDITMLDFPFPQGSIVIEEVKDGFAIRESGKRLGILSMEDGVSVSRKGRLLTLRLTKSLSKEKAYFIGDEKEITVGMDGDAVISNIQSEHPLGKPSGGFSLLKLSTGWRIEMEKNCPLYINGEKQEGSPALACGDILQWGGMELRLLEEDVLAIRSITPVQTVLPEMELPASEMAALYPEYRRTPRMIYDLPDERVTITFPTQESEYTGRGLWLIVAPPLAMLIVLGLVAILIPRGIFIIISVTMFTVTLITSTIQYFNDKKRRKQSNEKRKRVYTAYLRNMREELYTLAKKQKDVLAFHFPSFEQMKHMTNQLSGRIWEKTLDSHDAFEFRLGTGSVPSSYGITMSTSELANRDTDDLLEQSRMMEEAFKEIQDAPITVGLASGMVGLIGKDSIIRKELNQILGQLAFFHSYHDVRFIYICKHADYSKVKWMKWLPQFTLPHMHAKGFIHNEQTRDQLLSSLYEMIRERDVDENKGKVIYSPHLVFIISDYQLIAEHMILEYLEGNKLEELGISVIFTASAQEWIPENAKTLVRYLNEREGEIVMNKKRAVRIPFRLDTVEDRTNETFARMLKTLNHQVGMVSSIPKMVGFLEMYGVKEVEQLPIHEFWLSNESAKSLAVPIGMKGNSELVELNLHEKAHGPHGLLAGTTGSGKSEFLQTLILSLAVNFHPHEVAFLLIDYKGGGMAQPFRKIPHLLGTITNIEGSKNFSMRALTSIKSELKRRQILFDRFSVSHIDDYTALYKEGVAEEPMPHLLLISDEFAELKSEEPEFIRELVSTARIGRSLGVHLILATQKPGGVIDEQIWSNARFRVALKVQDESDSKEILKNNDAASITVTGRGYMQVGNNEVYELFQSAYSRSPYLEETFEGEDEIAIVTDLGLYPLSGIRTRSDKGKAKITEIEVVTEKIVSAQHDMGIRKLRSPWLPPLAMRIEKPALIEKDTAAVPIGMIDEAEKQSQTQIGYQLMEDGNVGVFGSPGYGKSYTLLTMLLGICEKLSPEQAHAYILDYGNGSLLPLRQLPHTADYLTLGEDLKRTKLIKRITEEMTKRKRAFQQAEVNTIRMYNEVADEPFPLWFIVIDNYDIVREEMEETELAINQFGRDGQALGIYLFVSTTRAQSIRQSLMNNLKTKIVHYLMDSSEAFGVVGRLPFDLEPFPGRAAIKKEESYFAQLYLPAPGANDWEVLDSMKETVRSLKMKYEGCRTPKSIPMLPLELTTNNFYDYMDRRLKAGQLPIGLDENTVQPIVLDFTKTNHCLIIGQPQRGKTNLLKLLLQQLNEQEKGFIGIFDSFDRGLAEFGKEHEVDYLETKERLTDWLQVVELYFERTEQVYLENLQKGKQTPILPSYFIIDGYTRFLQTVDAGIQDRLAKLMKKYTHLGFNIIVSISNAEVTKGYDVLTNELKLVRQAVLFMRKSEQTLYTIPYERKEPELPMGYAHYILNGQDWKLLTPLCQLERKIAQ
ncbi:ESX secretion system protein YukB [Sporosarcina sp. NCCP-2222]|uniref:type VII secretion protein EssC n=1 Tax=Sporosarcina sp. NCCP-2222 TaxID=2935073 RepID=UPI002086CB4F|nr:type VII secretion protein EssC [Sporosarcina sp. NCCP-2222]GKV55015.1 ESX secretion system protein YukB [Sporosarcina sp. NCCP-2222]